MNQTAVFHIGYHKTGTTFLQKNIFEKFSVFNRVDQFDINRAFIYPGPFHFSLEQARAFVHEKSIGDRINVFSNERLSGGPHYGGRDAREIADRIFHTCPNAKIIIVVREQLSAIQSAYMQYVKACGSLSLKEYVAPSTRRDLGSFRKEHFEYHYLVGYYQELFGKDKVLCLPYELMRKDLDLFLRSILSFTGLLEWQINEVVNGISDERINAQLNYYQTQIKRYFNPFISADQKDLGGTFKSGIMSTSFSAVNFLAGKLVSASRHQKKKAAQFEFLSDHFKDYFQESNIQLQGLTGIDLKSLNYIG